MISLADIVTGTGGQLRGAAPVGLTLSGIAHHSGRVRSGELFIAIRGEVHDGHAFIGQARANGAAALLVADDWTEAPVAQSIPVISVPNTVTALQRLARFWRDRRPDLQVVGITGSVGKTTTKEAIAGVLGQHFRTHKNEGNLNTEIGLPLMLLGLQPEHEAMVLEIGGAYAMGEVALLAGIARPQIGVVTNVGPTHLQRMGTIEAIAATKSELVQSLPADGLAILNGDDPRVRAMADRTSCRVLTYGQGADCDLRADQIVSDGFNGLTATITMRGAAPVSLAIPLPGRHSIYTALAAAAVGRHFGIGWEEIAAGLMNCGAKHRLQRVAGPNGALLIDDTYNASPASMRAALQLLAEVPARRRLVVLGGMAELGSQEQAGHAEIGQLAAQSADQIVTYGPLARLIAAAARAARASVMESESASEIIDWLQAELREGDVALIKGSRGLAMEEIVEALAVR